MKLGRKSTGRRREPRNVSREGVEGGEAAQEWPYLGSSYFFPHLTPPCSIFALVERVCSSAGWECLGCRSHV